MPRIFDNISTKLLPALQETLELSDHADFCVGYFNLRGWKHLDAYIEKWSGGEEDCCRLLVGMQKLPKDELWQELQFSKDDIGIDNQAALRFKKKLAEEFRDQLTIGVPTNEDESGLRRLANQIKTKKVIVKLFLRHSLHAKLYLLFRPDPINPIVGYLGSSNLTFSGLSNQGELNVDIFYKKVNSKGKSIGYIMSPNPTEHRIYYKITGVGHWFTFTLKPPTFWRDGQEGKSTRESTVSFQTSLLRDTAYCCLYSSLHYWLYQARTNCRDFNPSDIKYLPLPEKIATGIKDFSNLAFKIMKRIEETSDTGSGTYSVGGSVKYQRFRPKSAKTYFDEIDNILAKYYGFTADELDFIINYDIKYRMG